MDSGLIAILAVVCGCLIVWGLVAAGLERWDVTAPIAFVLLGLVVTHGPITLLHLSLHSATIRSLAEVTLALVLFSDASRVNAKELRTDVSIPARLLGIGLPLTIGIGAVIAAILFRGSGLWVAALIAAAVAPTDAAFGASIIQDSRVPRGVRRGLNVESGLNDGIAAPFVNLFLAGALASEAASNPGVGRAVIDLVGGAALGIGVGVLGALLMNLARKARWSQVSFRPLSVFGLALFAYAVALLVHTNGFVAAFAAGMAFGAVIHGSDEQLTFSEDAGMLLSLLVWFAFGAAILVPGLEAAGWRDLVFAVLALTVVRMVPVAVALAGSGLHRGTVVFIGWFGPRGLASVVFGLIAVDALKPADARVVLGAVTITVALSVLLHGVTASPLTRRYAQASKELPADRPEHASGPDLRSRRLRGSERGNADEAVGPD